ncbi:PTS system, glucose-specific IIBC component [Spiroplasma sp. TIUS-1]|uniref:PTS transporter subunit EIIC n=1 Tax=Spiroplasma sp. TIUS-1 TaxID=216963 RepID=UPI00139907C1|nr:PTS transporter subunit EIIC [Spiroplasma sp. TIUS-1]QHX36123.1 PTS system, glucose-specific IIBC component [Spiroplasma sp. TIUS-1]
MNKPTWNGFSSGFKAQSKAFGKGIMPTLSKLSKAFLLPIALLPIAGVFLGVGAAIANQGSAAGINDVGIWQGPDFVWYLGTFMNKIGDVCFGNLPILFCISVALAYSKDSGIAAITAVVGFLVMNGAQAALIQPLNHIVTAEEAAKYLDEFIKTLSDEQIALISSLNGAPWTIAEGWEALNSDALGYLQSIASQNGVLLTGNKTPILGSDGQQGFSLLWYGVINSGLITNNIGIQSLNTGVFAGIFVGAIAAAAYNKYHTIQLPSAISFFSGTKFVPIATFVFVLPLSFIFMFIWPLLGTGLAVLGEQSGKAPMGVSSFIFEMIERSLVPFGLHHVFYAPLWWTSAGGSISETINKANEAFTSGGTYNGLTVEQFIEKATAFTGTTFTWSDFFTAVSTNEALYSKMGDQYMMAAVISNLNNEVGINFMSFEYLGLNMGQYQSGKFGFMMLGLPMAAVAMFLNVPKENRKNVMGIYFSAAFTCFLTGITEPLEYTFLFLAPWLFYGVHMPLAAISFGFAGLMGTHISMTVSGGFIDYIVFGIVPFLAGAMSAMSAFGILIVVAAMGPIYFFAFYYAVKYGKVMVPGRDGSSDAQLATKADYKAAKGIESEGNVVSSGSAKDDKEDARMEKARKIIEFLGGEENILDVDSCASRLRLTLVDNTKFDKAGVMSLGGTTGALVRGTQTVQIVYGGEQEAIKPRMIKILKEQRAAKKAA